LDEPFLASEPLFTAAGPWESAFFLAAAPFSAFAPLASALTAPAAAAATATFVSLDLDLATLSPSHMRAPIRPPHARHTMGGAPRPGPTASAPPRAVREAWSRPGEARKGRW